MALVTIDDYNGKKETRFIPFNYAETVDYERKMSLLDLQHAKNHLQDIDDQILKLAYEREYAIRNLEIIGNKVLGDWICTANALNAVVKAYRNLGWKSKLVCAFVGYLRKIFFDDDSKSFKKIICYGITSNIISGLNSSANYSVDCIFGPKKYDPNRVFKIYLPGNNVNYNWNSQFIETNIKVFKMFDNDNNNFYNSPMIAKSSKLVDIRKAIDRFVKNGEYEKIEWDTHERDRVQKIVKSLENGSMRIEESKNMVEYVGV